MTKRSSRSRLLPLPPRQYQSPHWVLFLSRCCLLPFASCYEQGKGMANQSVACCCNCNWCSSRVEHLRFGQRSYSHCANPMAPPLGSLATIYAMAALQQTSFICVAGMTRDNEKGHLHSDESTNHIAFLVATTGTCRVQEMRRAFSSAAPDLGELSLHEFAHAIDVHEDFEDPKGLSSEITSGALVVHYAAPGDGWRLNFISRATRSAGQAQAVDEQIQKQKTLFPARGKFVPQKSTFLNASRSMASPSIPANSSPSFARYHPQKQSKYSVKKHIRTSFCASRPFFRNWKMKVSMCRKCC